MEVLLGVKESENKSELFVIIFIVARVQHNITNTLLTANQTLSKGAPTT